MRRRSGVLTMMVMLAALFGLVSGATAEVIKVKMDRDRVKDPVLAGKIDANTTRVATRLSSRNDKLTYVDFPGGGSAEPFIRAKGDVNKGKGAELFVRTARNDAVEVISVLTVARGNLINARSFYVDSSLGDGLAVGIKCGTVNGEPGIRTYLFRLGNKGRWKRTVTPYHWRKGLLRKAGKSKTGKIGLPSPTETTIGCPKPPPAPEPPPVLGSAGNRYFSGIGTVEPKRFSAKQGSGRYFSFTWKGWGDARATARGSFNTGSGGGDKRMNLTAFDLGQCNGREAYRKLTLKAAGGSGITLGVC